MATEGFLKIVELMAEQYNRLPPEETRRRAQVAFVTVIGARIVTDPKLSVEVLEEAERSLSAE